MKITKLLKSKWNSIVVELKSIFSSKEKIPSVPRSQPTRRKAEDIFFHDEQKHSREEKKKSPDSICKPTNVTGCARKPSRKAKEKTDLGQTITYSTVEPKSKVLDSEIDPYFVLDPSKRPKFIFSQPLNTYRLVSLPTNDEDLGESGDIELIMGLDFGTSTLKCFLHDADMEKAFPVIFCEGPTTAAYLLPTCIYIAQDQTISLEETDGEQVLGIKERLLNDHINICHRSYACAFLALALRRVRAWCKDNLREWYGDSDIHWIIHLGVPSISADHAIAKTWEEILCQAWNLSIQNKPINLQEIKGLLSGSETSLKCRGAEVDVCPEISAAIHSVISCTHNSDNGQLYAAMDVGASTVDITGFFFTKGRERTRYSTTLLGPEIHVLGTSFCHRNRILSLKKFVDGITLTKEEREQFIKGLRENVKLQPQTALPDSVESYCEGVKLAPSKLPPGSNFGPDKLLIEQLSHSLRTRILESWRGGFPRSSEKIKVLLIGGGCHSGMYAETIRRAVLQGNKNRAEIMEFPEIPEKLSYAPHDRHAIGKESFWQRFSVAYGLALGRIGETKIIALEEGWNPYELKELPGFISKDMV